MTLPSSFSDAIGRAAAEQTHVLPTVPVVPGLSVHIDGDFLAYNAAGNDDTLPGQARLNLLGVIETLRARVGAEKVVVHSTVPHSTKGERFLIATVKPYQGNRSGGRKPKNWRYLQDFLLNYSGDVFLSKLWSTREADDGIAACAYHAIGRPPGYAAIATKDKDLRMLPGVHINWDSLACTRVLPGDYDVIGEDGKQYGLKWFWLQMLEGDAADHIPGLEAYINERGKPTKIGTKTAAALLAPAKSTDEACAIVMDLYRGFYGETWADRFVEQAALLWMRLGAAEAAVDDFALHMGHSRINAPFTREIWEAVDHMKERVIFARQQIDELSSQNGT